MSYWDSKTAAQQLSDDREAAARTGLRGVLARCGLRSKRAQIRLLDDLPSSSFAGEWSERNRLNVPGPFYGADTDTCCCGPLEAPDNVLIDESGQEFVWRQPKDPAQLQALLQAARSDPFCGYAWDGDEHWTTELVRDWWATRGEVSEWIDRQLGNRELLSSDYNTDRAAVASLQQFRAYFTAELESDLREYMFWLEKRRARADDEPLPMLTQ